MSNTLAVHGAQPWNDTLAGLRQRADGDELPLVAVRPAALAPLLAALPPSQAQFARQTGFAAQSGQLCLLAGPDGLASALVGLGEGDPAAAFGGLPAALPPGTAWALAEGDASAEDAVLWFALGSYRQPGQAAPAQPGPVLLASPATAAAQRVAAAICMARDLINLPPNQLGPQELAAALVALADRYGAASRVVTGAALDAGYPAVAAVGAGSSRPPAVAQLRWQGSAATAASPLVWLCGKGVCFDTGGYDLKPSAGMLRMKKDMAGAAVVLAMARMMMDRDLPIRLVASIGCVENSVSGSAMRPLDVIATRAGLRVEIGNTDAEGRLVLCDLLAEAMEAAPALVVDCATLTGAARAALGPELPALFTTSDIWAARFADAGAATADPVWRLPLWPGYAGWLHSDAADLNNVSSKPFAGAIVAALFLQRFVRPGIDWAHFDLYGWNDATTPGHPQGGECQTARATVQAVVAWVEQHGAEPRV